ncbi:MAG: ferrous iron transport protein B [Planctomycetes bacterium]|nr:ferrous iron transport protein B [Planctomycetota bacterium]
MSSTIDDISLTVLSQTDRPATIALVGNPNAGKTSVFNRLTGLRAQTANFPGTTVEHRRGRIELGGQTVTLLDLPGLYTLDAVTPDERVAVDALEGKLSGWSQLDAVLVILDATNLERNLFLASQVLDRKLPTVVALNMIDITEKHNLHFDLEELCERLGCPVVAISARSGRGMDVLSSKLAELLRNQNVPVTPPDLASCSSCSGCQYSARYDWAENVSAATSHGDTSAHGRLTEAIDRILTHKVVGLGCFAAIMVLTFIIIFWMAQYPMDLIDGWFGLASQTVGKWLPAGDFSSLVTDGIIGGVGGMLVFLPQICMLFFMLALLEDSGYLARAAFVMDRLMHRVGLPGKAFVPLLSAHACAIPAIMSARVIEDRRDRLATILVLPLMTCSARLPVYAMVMGLLFPTDPVKASLLFAAAYALGIVTTLVMAWVFKQTLLKGKTRPLVIELPNYRVPSLRNALLLMYDRAMAFVKSVGTTIMMISLIVWALATYPKTPIEEMPTEVQSQIATFQANGETKKIDRLISQVELENSFAGQLGRGVEPVFAPLGFDWKMSVGVISSFAAREVIVATLAVLYGIGEDGAEDGGLLIDRLRNSTHADGRPVFTTATCLSMLVFYVLAMQCLPTQVVTRRETGSWKWPLLQLGYMSVLAYVAALVTYQVAAGMGFA